MKHSCALNFVNMEDFVNRREKDGPPVKVDRVAYFLDS